MDREDNEMDRIVIDNSRNGILEKTYQIVH